MPGATHRLCYGEWVPHLVPKLMCTAYHFLYFCKTYFKSHWELKPGQLRFLLFPEFQSRRPFPVPKSGVRRWAVRGVRPLLRGSSPLSVVSFWSHQRHLVGVRSPGLATWALRGSALLWPRKPGGTFSCRRFLSVLPAGTQNRLSVLASDSFGESWRVLPSTVDHPPRLEDSCAN